MAEVATPSQTANRATGKIVYWMFDVPFLDGRNLRDVQERARLNARENAPDTTIPELDRTLPIHQPLLWVTRPRP